MQKIKLLNAPPCFASDDNLREIFVGLIIDDVYKRSPKGTYKFRAFALFDALMSKGEEGDKAILYINKHYGDNNYYLVRKNDAELIN